MVDRREFLKKAGLAVGVTATGTTAVSRVVTKETPIEIRLFFTPKKYEQVAPHIDSFVANFQERFRDGLANAVSLPVTVSYRETPVPILDEADLLEESPKLSLYVGLERWYTYHSNNDFETADHANILIGKTNAIEQGVGFPALTPSCCLDFQRFGVVWSSVDEWPVPSFRERDLYWLIAHEVGHNIGLTHAHGCNHKLDARSVMLKPGYAKLFGRNLFGDPVVTGETERVKFNEKITVNHLAL